MKIYIWNNKWASNKIYGGYARYNLKECEDPDQLTWIKSLAGGTGKPIDYPDLRSWQPPVLEKEEKGKLGDCAYAFSCVPIISHRAKYLLADIWEKDARLYPVYLAPYPYKIYYLVVPRHQLDCVDGNKTTFGCGGLSIESLKVIPEVIGDRSFFSIMRFVDRIHKWYDLGYHVTEHFKQRVTEEALEGFLLIDSEEPRDFINYFISKSAKTLKQEEAHRIRIQQFQQQITQQDMLGKGVQERNLSPLIQCYETVLQQILTKSQLRKITQINYEPFSLEFSMALNKALDLAGKNIEIKSIYFEYHDDESAIFLCQSFDPDDEDVQWATDIAPGKEGVIEVGSVRKLFPSGLKIVLPEAGKLVHDYLHVKLLNACLEKIKSIADIAYPIGIANHDDGRTECIMPR